MATDCDVTINSASSGNSLSPLGGGWIRSAAGVPRGIGRKATFGWPRVHANASLSVDPQRFIDLSADEHYRPEPQQA